MKKIILSILLLSALLSPSDAPAQKRPTQDPCANPRTQTAMNECADREYKAADLALNKIYKQLLSKLEGEQREGLKRVEQAWLKYRDANCDFEASFVEGGSMQPLVRSSCLADLTKKRTAELRRQLESLE